MAPACLVDRGKMPLLRCLFLFAISPVEYPMQTLEQQVPQKETSN